MSSQVCYRPRYSALQTKGGSEKTLKNAFQQPTAWMSPRGQPAKKSKLNDSRRLDRSSIHNIFFSFRICPPATRQYRFFSWHFGHCGSERLAIMSYTWSSASWYFHPSYSLFRFLGLLELTTSKRLPSPDGVHGTHEWKKCLTENLPACPPLISPLTRETNANYT